jgi:hypothetical protein
LSFGSAFQSTSARADGITPGTADYTLTTTTAIPAPTGPAPGTPSVTVNTTLISGSPNVTLSTTTGVGVGYAVSGTGVPSGTTVSSMSAQASQLTLSQSATVSGSESLVYTPPIIPQVVALVEPSGGIVTPPASATTGPLTILANSTGFNSSGVYDFLATKTDANGNTLQALGLSFYGQGLAAGGILNFSLNVANQNAPPQLVSQTSGVTISLNQPTDQPSASTSGDITASEVPEPFAFLLWSVLAGAGLLRARASQRSNGVARAS